MPVEPNILQQFYEPEFSIDITLKEECPHALNIELERIQNRVMKGLQWFWDHMSKLPLQDIQFTSVTKVWQCFRAIILNLFVGNSVIL